MKQYNVELTMIHNLTLTIEAESSEAAIRYVEENREELAPAESFTFGEITIDYADVIESD